MRRRESIPCRRLAKAPVLLAWVPLSMSAISATRAVAAEEMPSFRIEIRDATITPSRLDVPANVPFKVEISNTGTMPAEFESVSLHKEKVLAAGTTSSMVFRRLAPGTYDFFDDFHPEAKAVLVAR